jgi:hypothetical protein
VAGVEMNNSRSDSCSSKHFDLISSAMAYISAVSHGSAVGIATGFRLPDRADAVRELVRSRIFTSPYRPDRFWSPSRFDPISTGALSLEKSSRSVKLATGLQIVPRSKNSFQGVTLN